MNINTDIISNLRPALFCFLSVFIISCGIEEETLNDIADQLTPTAYNLNINFIQTEENQGSVNIVQGGLICTQSCSSNIESGTIVNLVATPKEGAYFTGWGGDCSGSTECQITMSSEKNISASFSSETVNYLLTLNVVEGGSVTLTDGVSECTSDCEINFIQNQEQTLTAVPDIGYIFTGWSGACSGNSTCIVTMTSNLDITANFEKASGYTLSTELSLGGSISIQKETEQSLSQDLSLIRTASIQQATGECFDSCQFNFDEPSIVEITPIPEYGYTFKSWQGDCIGNGTCRITIDGESEVIAIFEASPTYLLTTSTTTGGVISLKDGYLNCPSETKCSFNILENEAIVIEAFPATGYTFTGWGGDCTGKSNCELIMGAERSLTATFLKISEGKLLTLQVSNGGTITLPGNLGKCLDDCELSFNDNEVLTLTAIADTGYTFTGWEGDCSGDTTCQVTMSNAHLVKAVFTEIIIETTLAITLNEGGSISFSTGLESCSSDCQVSFSQQEALTLTAIPDDGYIFQNWSGDCTGSNNCVVDMTFDQSITAIFKAKGHTCTSQATLPASSFDNDTQYTYKTLSTSASTPDTFLTNFSVKESTGNGASNYPVSMVFPVAQGEYLHPGDFYIKNSNGDVIPAQFNVINRWWAKEKRSLRHIQAHFNVDVEPYTLGQSDTGIQHFSLYAGHANIDPNYSVCATETDTQIVLDNGLVDITITKDPLTITTPAGELKSLFVKENGDDDYSFDHDNITIELEEIGYLRTIVKISSLTNYVAPTNIKHGWALRLYMYADSNNVKVDFQLQNSAINTAISAPLYFKSHTLRIENAQVSVDQTARADEIPLSGIENLPLGVIHTDNVNVMLRNFWQTFPNGLSANTDGSISVELWPAWSKQFHSYSFVEPEIYWLDDMKQTYKEVLLDFSGQSNTDEIQNLAKAFQYPPVAVIPQDYYAKTSVTTSYGGAFPTTTVSVIENRVPTYSDYYYDPSSSGGYKFGMDNFGLDTARKWATGMAGGWPYSRQTFLLSGDPVDYYNAQDFAAAEINIRPQWLSGYKDELHYDLLTPSTNPYGGNTWRRFLGHSYATSNRDYIDGTSRSAYPRDDQHAWFYHVEHAYLMSGNKWLKDWYEFMAEFKKVYLSERDPYPDSSHRAEGEALAIALAAYKYTGNETFKPFVENYIVDIHRKRIVAPHFLRPDKDNSWKIAAFQLGYLLREFIGIYTEFPENPTTLETIENYVKWNYEYGQFSYYRSVTDMTVSTTTSETSLSLVDSVIWFAAEKQEEKYAEHAINYVEVGLNGKQPYGNWSSWVGQFEASVYMHYKQNTP